MFSFMCLIWSLWNSPSVDKWWAMLRSGATGTVAEWGPVIVGLVVGFAVLVAGHRAYSELKSRKVLAPLTFRSASVAFTVSAAVVCILASPKVSTAIEQRYSFDVAPLVTDSLNRRDAELLHSSYYEDLIAASGLNSRLWELEEQKKSSEEEETWKGIFNAGILARTDTIAGHRLLPGRTLEFKGATMTTNEHGMRDRPYSLVKPPNTYRIAVFGASIEMGSGVEDDETFENVAEDRINAEGSWSTNLEILNFSMGGKYLINHVERAPSIVDSFQVDAVILFLHEGQYDWFESKRSFRVAMRLNQIGLLSDYPEIKDLTDSAAQALSTGASKSEIVQMYAGPAFFESILGEFEKIRDEQDVLLAVAYLENLSNSTPDKTFEDWLGRVLKERKIAFWDYSNIFSEALKASSDLKSNRDLWIRPWDQHPNATGHEIIARRFMQDIEHEIIGAP
jgi:hypothetical protein